MSRSLRAASPGGPELTFIVLARPEAGADTASPADDVDIPKCPMVGDVNMFLPDGPTGDVECEIMIAG